MANDIIPALRNFTHEIRHIAIKISNKLILRNHVMSEMQGLSDERKSVHRSLCGIHLTIVKGLIKPLSGFNCHGNQAKIHLKAPSYAWESLIFICSHMQQ